MNEKKCIRCHEVKAASEFWKDPAVKSGLQGACRQCQMNRREIALKNKLANPKIPIRNEKKCNRCEAVKKVTEFFRDVRFPDMLSTICKLCKQDQTQAWRVKNKDKYNADMRAYNAKHYQRLRLQRYRLTPEQHAAMMAKQGGVCALCKKLPNGKRPLCIDHNHKTKKVRGLLCYGCNRAIVILDGHDLFIAAQQYLKDNN